jgi:hypothetical protein
VKANRRSIDDINKNCLKEFRRHWSCLDTNNQQLWQCRPAERVLNKCVFETLVSSIYPLLSPDIVYRRVVRGSDMDIG